MGNKTTAEDVARRAGVSAATVDRVLNNRGGVAKEKELRVLEAARALRLDRSLDMREARTLRVGVYLQPPSNAFHASLAEAFACETAGPNPYNIQPQIFHVQPNESGAKMVRRDGDRYDAIVISLPNNPDLVSALNAYAKGGKPVVALVSDVEFPAATYVGLDNYQAGRLAGELVGRFLGKDGGEVVVIVGLLTMTGQKERLIGFSDVISERFPNCRIFETYESHESVTRPGQIVERALLKQPGLSAVYNASTGVTSVARVLEQKGLSQEIVFVGHDFTQKRRKFLKCGTIDALIDQEPKREVATTFAVIAEAYGRLASVSLETEQPVRVYLRENC